MNTYGIHSVNRNTFNQKIDSPIDYPKEGRDRLLTLLRVNNLFLNALGYYGGKASMISGNVRMVTGATFITITLLYGTPENKPAIVAGHFYKEALLTGVTQIARGILEAFVPYGRSINLVVDVITSIPNISSEINLNCSGSYSNSQGASNKLYPHDDVDYPLPFKLLYLA